MVFILGTNYPERMLVRNMLTKLYGISQTSTTYFVRAPATHPSPEATEALTEPKPVGSYTSSRTTPWSYNILARNPTNSQSQNEHVKGAAEEGDLPLPSARKHSLLSRIMAKHYIHSQQTLGTLSHAQVQELAQTLTDLTIENDLRRRVQQDVRRLHEIGSYRGRRHAMNLPARGQRTRTQNATAIKLNKLNRHG